MRKEDKLETKEKEDKVEAKEKEDKVEAKEKEKDVLQEETSDLSEVNNILNYGVALQKQVADISNVLLKSSNQVEMDEVSEALTQTVSQLQAMEATSIVGGKKLLGKKAQALREQNALENLLVTVEHLEETLEAYRTQILMNAELFHFLKNMSSTLGEKLQESLQYAREWKNKLQKNEELGQKLAADMVTNEINYLEHRIEQLGVTKEITGQQVLQIQMLESSMTSLLNELQTILFHVIPLWKNNVSAEIFQTKNMNVMEQEIHQNNQMLLGGLDKIMDVQKETQNKGNEITTKQI